MKKNYYLICLFLSLMSLFSCTDKKMKEVTSLISANESKLNKQQQDITEDVRNDILTQNFRPQSRSRSNYSGNFLTLEEIKKLTFTTIPCYELDTSFISSELEHERLQEYIKPVLDKPMFLGKIGDNYAMMMNTRKLDNIGWTCDFCMEGVDYFQSVFSWLLPELEASSKKNFHILYAFGQYYIVYYTKEEKPMYCNFPGNIRMDELRFFQYVTDRHNDIQSMKELINDWDNTKDNK